MVLLGNMRTSETVAPSSSEDGCPVGVVVVKGNRTVAGCESSNAA